VTEVDGGRLFVEVVSDTTGFRAALQRKLDAELRGLRAKIDVEVAAKVEFDRAQIRRELATKLAQAANKVRAVRVRVEIETDFDPTELRRRLEAERRRFQRQPWSIQLRVDRPVLAQIAQHIGNSLTSLTRMPLMASGILLAAGAATNLAGGLFAVASAASQAAGVGAALPGIYATAAQAFAAFKIGLGGVGDAVKQLEKEAQKAAGLTPLQQAMANLSPEGRKLARTVQGTLLPELKRLRFGVQDAIAPPMVDAIKISRPLFKTLRKSLTDTGARAGALTKDFARLASSGPFRKDLGTIMASNNRAFSDFGRAGLFATSALRHVMVAAGPLLERISGLALRLAQLADRQAKAGRESGRMAAFFDRAWSTATKLVRITKDVVAGILNIGKAARPTGDTLLDDLAKSAADFRAATADPANQERMRIFFEQTIPLMQQTGDLLTRLVMLFVRLGEATGGGTFDGLFAVLNTAVAVLEKIAAMPGAGGVLSTIFLLAGAGTGLGLVAKALSGLVTGLATLARFTGLAALFRWFIRLPWVAAAIGRVRAALLALRNAAISAARAVATFAANMLRAAARGVAAAIRTAGAAILTAGRAALSAARSVALWTLNMLRAAAVALLSAARTAAHTAAIVAQRVAMLAIRGAVLAWAAAQWLLNAAWSASPIGVVILAIAALVAGIVWAYKNVGWFRAAVDAVFRFLKTAVVATIDFVRKHWRLILTVILGPLGIMIGLVTKYWRQIYNAVASAVTWTINFVRDHWRLILAVVLGPLGLLIGLVTKYWRSIYNAVAAAVTWVINFVRSHWRLLITIITGPLGLIVSLVTKYWNQIKAVFSAALRFVLARVRAEWNRIRAAFSSALNAIVGYVTSRWNAMRRLTDSLASSLRSKINSLMSALRSAFSRGVSAIGSAWSGLRNAAKSPVNFVIGTVYNKGIVDNLWNRVVGWLKLGHLKLGHAKLLAKGGTITDPAPARPMVTNKPTAIVGEGGRHPEFVIPTDPKYRTRAQALWAAAGSRIQMLQFGGVLGGALKGIKKIAGKVGDIGKTAMDLITNPAKVWDRLAAPVFNMVSGIGDSSPWGQAVAAVPKKMAAPLRSGALAVIKTFADAFGGDSKGVVKAAVSMLGQGDDRGPNNNWITRKWGMVGAPWCAMFVSEAISKAKATKAYRGYPSAAVASYVGAMRHVSQGRPGDLGAYRGTGHINVIEKALGGGQYQTIGGNENAKIQRNRRGGQSSILRPMARGGVLARDLISNAARLFHREAKGQLDRHEMDTPLVALMQHLNPDTVRRLTRALIDTRTSVAGPKLSRDRGGPLPPGSWAFNGLSGTEWVLTPEAVDLLGGDRAVAAINATARRVRGGARPAVPGAAAQQGVTQNIYPQPRQSEIEIAMVAARKLGAMLA
jgi:uncharacterized membrane protein